MLFLADTSAWHRATHPDIAPRWGELLARDEIATTEPVMLEVLYSAQSGRDYREVAGELEALRFLPCSTRSFNRALRVQRELAERRPLHHRVPVTDLLIAAVAEYQGAILWHYDADFDRIAEVTGQPTEWIAPRGTL